MRCDNVVVDGKRRESRACFAAEAEWDPELEGGGEVRSSLEGEEVQSSWRMEGVCEMGELQ